MKKQMKRLRKGRGRGPGVRWLSMDPWEEKGASHPFCCPLLDLTGSRSQTGEGPFVLICMREVLRPVGTRGLPEVPYLVRQTGSQSLCSSSAFLHVHAFFAPGLEWYRFSSLPCRWGHRRPGRQRKGLFKAIRLNSSVVQPEAELVWLQCPSSHHDPRLPLLVMLHYLKTEGKRLVH